MKSKYLTIIAGITFAVLQFGCTDFNDQFDGLDDLTKPKNKASYTYQLTDDNYKVIGQYIQKPIADSIKIKQTELANATTHEDSITIKAEIEALKLDPTYLLGATVIANKYLTSTATGPDYVPIILNTQFKYGDIGSIANVTFNYNLNDLEYLSDFAGATSYVVSSLNYTSVGEKVGKLGAFTPSFPSENYIPDFLSSSILNPIDGKLAFVSYSASDIEPVLSEIPTITTVFTDDFEDATLDNFITYNVTGAQVWSNSIYGGGRFAKISGYSGGNNENEDWLIIPSINLSSAAVATLEFSSAHKYAGDTLKVMYSLNYEDGENPNDYTWTSLAFNFESGTGTFAWTPSGEINIPGMPQANIYIAFVYNSSTSSASTWEIDNISVKYKNSNADIPVKSYNEFYKYNNSMWTKASNVICIQPFEYAQMGAPGNNNYFSSTVSPENYLPTYLNVKYPLSIEGDSKIVVYNYNSNGTTSINADDYRFSAGEWTRYSGIVSKSEQYVFSTIGWAFDPTVNHEMVYDDYKLMVDYVLATPEISIFAHPYYKNEEFYWGFNHRYSNINFRLSYRNPYFTGDYVQPATIDQELSDLTTNDQKIALLWTRIQGGLAIFLQLRYPDAVPTVNGIDVYYNVNTKIYYPDGVTYGTESFIFKFKCTAAGTPPSFEFISYEKVL